MKPKKQWSLLQVCLKMRHAPWAPVARCQWAEWGPERLHVGHRLLLLGECAEEQRQLLGREMGGWL